MLFGFAIEPRGHSVSLGEAGWAIATLPELGRTSADRLAVIGTDAGSTLQPPDSIRHL